MKLVLIIVVVILGAVALYLISLRPGGQAFDPARIPTEPGAAPIALEQQTEGDEARTGYSPDVFRPVSELVADRLNPWVIDIHFKNKFHKGYIRHDIVEVDINQLTQLVTEQTDLFEPSNAEEGYTLKKIQLPMDIVVANDKIISVVFDTVSMAMPGKFAISGHTMGNLSGSQVQLTIDHTSGRIISGHVFDGSKMHTIVKTSENPYYLVTEAVPQPTLVDDEIIRNGN